MRNVAGDVVVRRATPDDAVALRRFEQEIIAVERPFDSTIRKGAVVYYDIEALIASHEAFVALADKGGLPIGCGFARKKPSPSYAEPPYHAYVGLMFVAENHRGEGVGKRILMRLAEWARASGLSEMRLDVYPQNERAIDVYSSAGFAPSMLEMRLPLGDEVA